MKIAFFTELYPPSTGGQETRFAEMAELLVKRGHTVDVFCINSVAGCAAEELVAGVNIHRYPISHAYQKPAIKALRRKPTTILRYAFWCRRESRKGFDVCIYNQWPLLHVVLAPAAARSNLIIDWCETRQGTLFSTIQHFLPRMAGKNMAVSLAVKEHIESVARTQVSYIPSGITRRNYRSLPRSFRSGLLYVGRITQHKNMPLLIEAYDCMRSRGYSGPLKIAGTGPALDEVRRKKQQSPHAPDIQILGFVTDAQKIELLASAEVFVIPSKREGFPRVIAEAMASGLPSVTPDFPENGAKTVLNQYGAGVVTADDAASLADGIAATLANWHQFSAAGLSASESLDWDVVLDEVMTLAGERATVTHHEHDS